MITGLPLIAGAGTCAAHYLFGVRFLIDRTALLFYPLFILALATAAQALQLAWRSRHRNIPAAILLLFAAGMSINFAWGANLKSARMWQFDANTREMLQDLQSQAIRLNSREKISLGVSTPLEASISYYARVESHGWLAEVDRDGLLAARYDFYYVFARDYERLDKGNLVLLKRYEPSGNLLLARRPPG